MGKRSKQGASLRAAKRAKVANQQLEQALAEQSEQHRVQSKGDEELFVIDTDRKETAASSRAGSRRKAEKEASKKGKHEYSVFEKRNIQKVVKTHGIEGTIALAEMGRARLHEKKIHTRTAAATVKPTFDIWDEPTPATASSAVETNAPSKSFAAVARPIEMPKPKQMVAKLSNKQIKARVQALESAPPTLAVEVAHPGQSYHPDKEHHQDAIGEALSIEIRRNEAVEYKEKPLSEGMSAFTKEFIVDSDAEEEESSDDEDEDGGNVDGNNGSTIVKKRKEKLTRAQRNKQKRAKAELTAIKERKQHKQFIHQANEVRQHEKAVKLAEAEQRERQEILSTLKMEKKSKPLGKDVWGTLSQKDPIRAPSFPVALTEELQTNGGAAGGGGLRTVTPKGSLVTDRLESMVARNMISKKKMEGRRIVQGKRRPKARGPEGMEYLLT